MIRPLRQLHRRTFALLCFALPVAFGISVVARKPVPTVANLPAELNASANESTEAVWERDDLFTKAAVRVKLSRGMAGLERDVISLSASPDFAKPDLIVYWLGGNPNVSDTLPDAAQLLGSFSASALKLPTESAINIGTLILFSLANQEIVDVSKPVRFNESKTP
jgi:hypothetical protein